jgi:hypothetical protein
MIDSSRYSQQVMSVIQTRSIVVLLLILAGMGSFAPLSAQSLADVAKKEEERRKKLPAPAKVYTNKDLSTVPAGTSPSGTATAPPAGAPAATDAPKEDKGPGKDQSYWSGRRKAIQEKLDRNDSFLLALQTRVNSLAADFVNRDDPAQRAVIERERLKAVADLGRLQQEITDGKKALADLDEEARRAGVPPGWLR